MEKLSKWMQEKLDNKLVEPNSGLGHAIAYMRKHWKALTLFLREAGAPLDNNACEQALKMAILHRKNSLIYKTEKGAAVGDLFMSLINTCRRNDVNPYHYMNALQRNIRKVIQHLEKWMPWNYKENSDTS
jgi:transposase